ncbi:NAD-dependent epimerase/dehydratase family protein [Pseudomonas putida]|uniref:NAD(P)-dependent oxidoreductase n=1 Tax=Pseudomonas putida TaxID=303 RepID=A0A6I6XEV6_PSEPU|nr:NAD(P)-dependent oxidoreductase [Pseudomonas putida]QHG63825.1 NAD(P)-dependent oxidoreductase [Pseudomonas putida]
MMYVIGSRGRLGQAICNRYAPADVVQLERGAYAGWCAADARAHIEAYFAPRVQPGDVVFVCSGLLDPALGREALEAVNLDLPRNLIEALVPMGVQVVTFGTVMEEILTANPYVDSKRRLGDYVAEQHRLGAPVTHVRIHTLYGGGEPSPFMFLGLIAKALRSDARFAMTSGRQLREYHHVDDDAAAIYQLVDKRVHGVLALSHGRPVTLAALAQSVFAAADKPDLLGLGELADPPQENFEHIFSQPQVLADCIFRDTLAGVNDYMKALV